MKTLNNNIEEARVSKEIHTLLKLKGFNNTHWNIEPTQQLAIDWIRVNFGIHIIVLPARNCYMIIIPEDKNGSWRINNKYISLKEAKEAALLYTLQNLIK